MDNENLNPYDQMMPQPDDPDKNSEKNKEHKNEENEDIRIFVDGGHGVHDMFLPG